MRFRILRWLVVLLLACASLTGCVLNPITGDRQLMLISADQEVQMGATAYQEFLKEAKVSSDAKAIARVQGIGKRIAAVADVEIAKAGLPPFQWEFTVVQDDETINAFCLPGGKVVFYTGILKLAADDAEVATVMGHEVAHAIARHGAERVSQGIIQQLGLEAVNLALGNSDPKVVASVQTAYGVATNLAGILPFSRSQEMQADTLGLRLTAQAGYDPRAALAFWKRMEAQGGGQPMEFLSTHPSHARRIENIEAQLPSVIPMYEESRKTGPSRGTL